MGFRGVTTNPPLALQAIKLAPELWAAEIKADRQRRTPASTTRACTGRCTSTW